MAESLDDAEDAFHTGKVAQESAATSRASILNALLPLQHVLQDTAELPVISDSLTLPNYSLNGGTDEQAAKHTREPLERSAKFDTNEEKVWTPAYDLRQGSRIRGVAVPGASLDQDESGDYDPSLKTEQCQWAPVRRKPNNGVRRVSAVSSDHSQTVRKARSWLAARQVGESRIIVLSLKSPEGLQMLAQAEDNWPYEDDWNSLAEPEPAGELQDIRLDQPYALRKRDILSKQHGAEGDPRQSYKHLHVGHPIARACIGCVENGQYCPLLEPDATYPCFFCVEDECDCELVVEPLRKRSCENCRNSRTDCSYRALADSDHSAPCTKCRELGLRCVAGPAIDRSRVRIMPDGSPAQIQDPDKRPYVACTACRRSRRTCSLLRDAGEPPCASCKASGVPCTFEMLTKRCKRSKTVRDGAVESHSKDARCTSRPDLPPGREEVIPISMISHPITFDTAVKHCNWCTQPPFSIVGWGEPRFNVRVWVHADGAQWTELSGGYRREGLPGSKMCCDCTYSRTRILLCEAHQLGVMQSARTNKLPSTAELYGELTRSKSIGAVRTELKRWCSICPSVAVVCCVKDSEGCGLRLCKTCAQAIAKTGLNVGNLIWRFKVGVPKALYPNGLRADFELLHVGGLLWSSLMKKLEQ